MEEKNVWSVFKKILSEEYESYLLNAQFVKTPKYHSLKKELELCIQTPEVLPFEVYESMVHQLKIGYHISVDLEVHADKSTVSMDELNLYVERLVEREVDLRSYRFLHPYIENDVVCFSTRDQDRLVVLKGGLPYLKEKLKKFGIVMDIECKQVMDDDQIETNVIALPEKPKPQEQRRTYAREAKTTYKIRDLQVGLKNAVIEGHIFSIDNRVLRSQKTMQQIYISDYDDAIIAKRFEGARCPIEEIESIKNGMSVRITGDVVYDEYSKCNAILVNQLEPISESKRKDMSGEKRVEWHVHSTFSEMDGVCAIEEYIQTAYDWGMDAIGVCDHQVVQAFPMAQHKIEALLKKDPNKPFKMLYGCEMVMVDPEYKIVFNNDHRKLEDATFVVFDLETTGLSQRLDKIIEFGAVKMRHREVVERKQMFINPKRSLPASIMNLTHIKQNDVDTAKPIEQALPELLDFIGDSILVAHNATFDVGFMNAACREVGIEEMTNPVIDSWPLSQALLESKRYNLGSVCRQYGVPYDGEGAHRADYDAQVLSQCLCHMMNAVGTEATLDTLQNLQKPDSFKKVRPSHVTVYAKNKEGLKELFELITLSHTTYLAYNGKSTENVVAEPRITREELEKKRKNGNLLIGSACQNGEIFTLAHTRSEKDLKQAMKFYDYIEVQPLACYKNMLDRHAINSIDDLKQILLFILDAAREMDKLVIATSDAHYVHPHEKRIRDVYINSKAIGNARHPLYIYNAAQRKAITAPDQHLLTTNEMLDAFEWLGSDLAYEIVIKNTRKLMSLTDVILPIKDKLYPPDIEGSDQKLRDICYVTAHDVYGENLPEVVDARLKRELDSIIGHGYYVVYYISHLLVKKSNSDGYLVGSRGSVGSSFVATMSGITEVNPLKPHYVCKKCHYYEFVEDDNYKSGFDLPDKVCPVCGEVIRGDGHDIPFETFLGFEGDKVPDIDLNFSGDYQPRAHAYTKEVFGDDHVFRAGTVGTVQEKTAYGYIRGYEEEMGIEGSFSEAKRVDLAKSCEGVKRTTGQHPGGIVVVPLDMDVHDFTPVQYPANNPYAEWKTTHFDFHQIHDNILKFDILGHVDPTAMKLLEKISGIDVKTIPMNDKATMSIFSSTEALNIDSTQYSQVTGAAGIPEFGTPFVRGILESTKPTTFAELVSISGLSHGTDVWLGNAKDLIDNGTCVLSEVIGCRDDIMIDLISYGMPSKLSFTIMESVRKGKGLKPDWIDEMKAHNVPEWFIDSCLKIKYMFPKAHAVAYVMMAVRIAWFKVHMPLVYYCQYFSIRCDAYDISTMISGKEAIKQRMADIKRAREDKTQKVSDKENAIYDVLELALEMTMRGYHFSNVSINRSDANEFILDPDDDKAIIPPFTSLDGLGVNVGKSVVAARNDKPFLSKEDVLKRTQLSKTLLDRLDQMGALEGLDEENQMTLF